MKTHTKNAKPKGTRGGVCDAHTTNQSIEVYNLQVVSIQQALNSALSMADHRVCACYKWAGGAGRGGRCSSDVHTLYAAKERYSAVTARQRHTKSIAPPSHINSQIPHRIVVCARACTRTVAHTYIQSHTHTHTRTYTHTRTHVTRGTCTWR